MKFLIATLSIVLSSAPLFADSPNPNIKCTGYISNASGMRTMNMNWRPNSNIIEGVIDQRTFTVNTFMNSLNAFTQQAGQRDFELSALNLHWPAPNAPTTVAIKPDPQSTVGIYCIP